MAFTGNFMCTSFKQELLQAKHDFTASTGHTFKLALYTNSASFTAATTDYTTTNEVSGTGYTADGYALTGLTYTEASGVATLDDTGNVTWSQNGAGPTDIYWAILYNDSAASDEAIGFLDMGGPVSLQDGDVTINWNASGILTVTVTA